MSSPAASASLRAKPRDARQRLLREARRLIQAHGYAGFTVETLLAGAGSVKGSLYHHFPGGKEDVAIAAVEDLAADVLKQIAELGALSPTAKLARIARLTAGWLAASDFREGPLLITLAAEQPSDAPALNAAVRAAIGRWSDALGGAPSATAMRRVLMERLSGAIVMARMLKNPTPLIDLATTLERGGGS